MLLTSGCQLAVLEGDQRKTKCKEIMHFSLDNKMHQLTIFAFDFVNSLVILYLQRLCLAVIVWIHLVQGGGEMNYP